MLTPQEVAQRSFSKASFGGYNMAMVDDFLDEVTTDYEALYNENALLKQKLGVLSGKIREYQSTEEAMRKTLLAAQEMSDKLVKETEGKCAQLLSDAEHRAGSMEAELAQGLSGEERKLQAARDSVEEYKKKVRSICQQQLDYLDQLDQIVPPVIPTVPAADSAAEDIQAAVERTVAQEEAAAPAPAEEPAPVVAPAAGAVEESSVSLYEQLMAQRRPPQEEDPTAPTRRMERRDLEFGKDFEID